METLYVIGAVVLVSIAAAWLERTERRRRRRESFEREMERHR